MAEKAWVRHAIQIGRFEFRRSVRALRQDRARFGLMAFGSVVMTLLITGMGFLFIDVLRDIEGMSIPAPVQGTIVFFWLFDVYMVAQRVASAKNRIETEPLMLTTVSARTVIGGLLIAEVLRMLAYVLLPAIAISILIAYALAAPLLLITVLLAMILFATTAVTAGSVIGYGVALLIATSPFVARHKTALGVPAAILGMGGIFLFQFPQVTGISQTALAWLPPAWIVDVAVLGAPIKTSLVHVIGIVIGSGLFVTAGGLVAEWETTSFWFSDDPATTTTDTKQSDTTTTATKTVESEESSALASAVTPFRANMVSLPVQRVAQMTVLRAWRDPQRLTFVLMPVVALGSSLIGSGGTDGVFATAPAALAVIIPWVAGAVFTLNPFGDEGAMLPITLTGVTGSQYVRGITLPGLLIGLPVAICLTIGSSFLSSYGILVRVGLGVLTVFLTIISVALGPLIGMTFPRFDAISVGNAKNVVPPRILAIMLHGAAIGIPGGLLALLIVSPRLARIGVSAMFGWLPGVLLQLLVNAGLDPLAGVSKRFLTLSETIQSISIETFRMSLGSVLGICGVIIAVLAYRTAIQRFDEFSPP